MHSIDLNFHIVFFYTNNRGICNTHPSEWNSGGRIESRQKPVAQIFCEIQELPSVPRHDVSSQLQIFREDVTAQESATEKYLPKSKRKLKFLRNLL